MCTYVVACGSMPDEAAALRYRRFYDPASAAMELIDGSGLLAMIEEHTNLKVKIVIPPRKS